MDLLLGMMAGLGIWISPPENYSQYADQMYAPASTLKLWTAHLALKHLGPDYTFKTTVRFRIQNGALAEWSWEADGDPTWETIEWNRSLRRTLDGFFVQLKNRGVTSIKTAPKLLTADPRLQNSNYPRGWEPQDYGAPYGALLSSFNIGLNVEVFEVTGFQSGKWVDPIHRTPITVNLRRGQSTQIEAILNKDGSLGLQGFWSGRGRPRIALPLKQGHLSWLGLIQQRAIANGISWSTTDPAISFKDNETTCKINCESVTYSSPKLSEILGPFLRQSLNAVAEMLLWKIAIQQFQDQRNLSLPKLVELLHSKELNSVFNTDTRVVPQLVDGSGLSRLNRISPRQMSQLMDEIASSPNAQILYSALPIAGYSGTLKRRMVGTSAAKRFFGKTGSLSGVSNLAGFLPYQNTQGKQSLLKMSFFGTTSSQADAWVVQMAKKYDPPRVMPLPKVSKFSITHDLLELNPAASDEQRWIPKYLFN